MDNGAVCRYNPQGKPNNEQSKRFGSAYQVHPVLSGRHATDAGHENIQARFSNDVNSIFCLPPIILIVFFSQIPNGAATGNFKEHTSGEKNCEQSGGQRSPAGKPRRASRRQQQRAAPATKGQNDNQQGREGGKIIAAL